MITIRDIKTGKTYEGRLILPLYVSDLSDDIEWLVEHIGRCELVNAREDLEEILEEMPQILHKLREKLDEMIEEETEYDDEGGVDVDYRDFLPSDVKWRHTK